MGLLSLLLKLCQADECEDFNYGLMNTKMRRTLHQAQKVWTLSDRDNGAARTVVKIYLEHLLNSKHLQTQTIFTNYPHPSLLADTYDKIVKTGMYFTLNYVLVLTDTIRFIHSMKKQTDLYFTILEVPKNIALILF